MTAFTTRTLVTALSLALYASGSWAAQPEALFSVQGMPRSALLPDHAVMNRANFVRINPNVLAQPRLSLELVDETVTAVRDRVVKGDKGQLSWIGHLAEYPGSQVFLTRRGNSLSGFIEIGTATYELSTDANGNPLFFEVAEESLPEHVEDMDALTPEPPADYDYWAELSLIERSDDATTTPVIDLMVVYTGAACERYSRDVDGACSNVESRIVNAIEAANQAYQNSQIDIQLNLVHLTEVNYQESGNMGTSLSDLRGTSDGKMDSVHNLRDQYGADVVMMVSQDSSSCGMAYVMQTPGSYFAPYAFGVTYSSCLSSQTLAHEIGHIQGNQHDIDNSGYQGAAPYAYGYRECVTNGFRTVMSYSCSGAPRISHFSNPEVYWDGRATGVHYDAAMNYGADTARSMHETASIVAAFRDSVVDDNTGGGDDGDDGGDTTPTITAPTAPDNLAALALGTDSIELSWDDNADDETGLHVRRSLDGANWSTVATLGADSTGYTDSGLDADTSYHYQVRAYNSAGNSDASNTATATTDAVLTQVEHFVVDEQLVAGSMSGNYSYTYDDDGQTEVITERESGGRPNSRYSYLEHVWRFDISGGDELNLVANVYSGGSSDGDAFNFAYSTNGSSYTNMFTVTSTHPDNIQTFALPSGLNGTVYIRVTDTDRRSGNRKLDRVYVDQLVIRALEDSADLPEAPSNLDAQVEEDAVSLSWVDNADQGWGFEILRSTDGGAYAIIDSVSADQTGYVDASVAPATTYSYAVRAFNGVGTSEASQPVSVTTPEEPVDPVDPVEPATELSLQADGYKVKGRQTVDLAWSGADDTSVTIYRDGRAIAQSASGVYRDKLGKGGGSYTYQVCVTADQCSNTTSVVF